MKLDFVIGLYNSSLQSRLQQIEFINKQLNI